MDKDIKDVESANYEKRVLKFIKIAAIILLLIFIFLTISLIIFNSQKPKVEDYKNPKYEPKTTYLERIFNSQKRIEDNVNRILFANESCTEGHGGYGICSIYEYSDGVINVQYRLLNLTNKQTLYEFSKYLDNNYSDKVIESFRLFDKNEFELGKIVLYVRDIKRMDESDIYEDEYGGREFRLYKTYEFPIEKAKKLYKIDSYYFDESF